jgi:hypothetical protein
MQCTPFSRRILAVTVAALFLVTPCLNTVLVAGPAQSHASDLVSDERLNARATISPNGVLVEWAGESGMHTLGFNVYRVIDGRERKLNPGLLAGPALISNPHRERFSWFDPEGANNSSYEVESVDLHGQSSLRVVAVNVRSSALPPYHQAELISDLGGGGKATQISNPEWRDDEAPDRSSQGTAGDVSFTSLSQQWAIANQPALKIGIRSDGWYRITQPQLQSAGFDTSKDAAQLQLFVEGNEVALSLSRLSGPLSQSDFIEFWAQGLDTPTTDTRVYWLVNGTQAGKRIAISGEFHPSTIAPPVTAASPATVSPSSFWYAGPITQPMEQTVIAPVDRKRDAPLRDSFVPLQPEPPVVTRPGSAVAIDPPAVPTVATASTVAARPSAAASPKAASDLGPARPRSLARRHPTHRHRRHAQRARNHAVDVNSFTPAFIYATEYKPRTVYYTAALNGDRENFFGPAVSGSGKNVTLTTRNVERSANNPAQLEVSLQGVSLGTHQVNVLVNGSLAGPLSWPDQGSTVQTFSIPNSWLVEGDNTVNLVPLSSSDVSLIDHLRVTYAHSFRAENDSLQFSVKSTQTVRIDGFSIANLRVVDVTDANSVELLHPVVESSGGGFAATIAGGNRGKARHLIAMPANQIVAPAWLSLNQPSTLNSAGNAADLVIISYKDFISPLAPLVAQRQAQGFTVSVVDVENVFDEFSYGEHTPQAIRDFMLRAKTAWTRAPSYLLLVGDATWDPRNYLGTGVIDYVPSKLIDTGTAGTATALETASDDWFTDFDGNGIAEISTGRIPVHNVTEANTVITKIINYLPANTNNSALLIADTQGSYFFNFEVADDQVGSTLPAGMSIQKIYRRLQASDPVAKTNIIAALNAGPAVAVYSGHGNVDIWGGSIFTATDAAALTNGNRLPFVVVMDCLNGYFADPNLESLSETLLKAPNGGAVAAFASSGLTIPIGQHAMGLQMFQLLYGGTSIAIGDASRQAKLATTDMDVRRTWILFGDPTLKIR